MRIAIVLFMLVTQTSSADRKLPVGSSCRAGWDTCVRDAACRSGYCTQVRNIPIGDACNPGLSDRCVVDAACRSLQCVRVRNIPIGGECNPGLGDTCARGAGCRGGTCAKLAGCSPDPMAWLFGEVDRLPENLVEQHDRSQFRVAATGLASQSSKRLGCISTLSR